MPPKSEQLAAALGALADLIRVTIESDEPGRFAVAARMCQTAHALSRESSTRVDDFCPPGQENQVGYGGLYVNQPLHAPHRLIGEADVAREAMSSALPMLERYGDAQTAQAERAETETIAALFDVRGSLPPGLTEHIGSIDARIETLLKKISERNKNAVVPAVVLRGHPTGEDRDGLRPLPGAAHPDGAGGRAQASQGGPGTNGQALGDG